eukprot:CAMPEP_0113603536 /NCGR_PEP_ID=MMETSP0017_2-20120614/1329_1 /TAXON_ID=2856 /ORGANISM="Cylindrotheca closterium" /LENGTH=117 /DNA_ID=CAMNT_0000511931 /DNA_START=39 /DNA_END=392 /DNA_ORIENTATION=+ /assembly_acc=CAM_ASM_000147
MGEWQATSQFCAVYSIVGVLFMFMVAMMLTYQPELIAGFDDYEAATKNTYGAMTFFFVTFVASIVYLIKESVFGTDDRTRQSGIEYEGIGSNSGSAIMEEYAMNLDLPPSIHAGYST